MPEFDPVPDETRPAIGWFRSRFNPWLFFGFLLAPAAISCLTWSDPVVIAGPIIAGPICGIHFTLTRRPMAAGLRFLVGIVAVTGCTAASFAIFYAGCASMSTLPL